MSEIWMEILREQCKYKARFMCPKCYESIKYRTPDLALVLYTKCDVCREETVEVLVVVRPC